MSVTFSRHFSKDRATLRYSDMFSVAELKDIIEDACDMVYENGAEKGVQEGINIYEAGTLLCKACVVGDSYSTTDICNPVVKTVLSKNMKFKNMRRVVNVDIHHRTVN